MAARVIILTNSEHPIAAIAARHGKPRERGELARLIDIPAVLTGSATIFNHPPGGIEADKLQEWTENRCRELRESVRKYHGVALPTYLERLLSAGPDKVRTKVRSAMEEFERKVMGEVSAPELRHASRHFAILYAAGKLAIDAGVLPRNPKLLLRDSLKCFRASTRDSPIEEQLTTKAVRTMVEALDAADLTEKSRLSKFGPRASGYCWTLEGKKLVRCAVRQTIFRSWFATAIECRRALRWLYENKLLLLRPKMDPRPRGFILKDVNKPGRFGKKTFRAVQFVDPRALARKQGHYQ